MLKPAICYKEQIENALKEYFYTDDMIFYMGCSNSYLLSVCENNENGRYQYAVVDDNDNHLVGYIDYEVDRYSSCVYNVSAFSFDRGNVIMGVELNKLFENLINTYHRVEFRAVSGNPAVKAYDRFLKRHSDISTKHILKDTFKDHHGNYHDDYIYEFVNPKN